MLREIAAEPVVDRVFQLGENPIWDDRRRVLLWTDIDAGELWELDLATDESRCFYKGPVVGGFTLQDDESLLLFRADDVVVLTDRARGEVVAPVADISGDSDIVRFNDVIATPEGDVLAGTIGADDERGGVYRLTQDGAITRLWSGTGISNGMAYSGDTLYWTCSTSRRIFTLHAPSPGERQVCFEAGPDDGIPDGLTVDVEEHLWSARWGASQVVRHTPQMDPVACVHVPAECSSSVCFGGDDLGTLYVTSAGGGLYRCRPGVCGRLEHRSSIRPGSGGSRNP